MINKERLVNFFKTFIEIDSVSKEEKELCINLKQLLDEYGAKTLIDRAGEKSGSNSGNLIATIEGTATGKPLLLSAHMDTVEPGRGVVFKMDNGKITSDGTTILGADDKSAIAIILEAIHTLKEKNIPHPPLELVFTVCEEIGLLGAKNLDFHKISARQGYVLDAGDTEKIITGAPASVSLKIEVHGKDAHAGSAPEKGINAISIASKAIATLSLGRIDPETTCNIGVIEGGVATNIVPNLVRVKGEVRSYNPEKLTATTRDIVASFHNAVQDYQRLHDSDSLPNLDVREETDYHATSIAENSPVVTVAAKAAANLGRTLKTKTAGGGSDANVFFSKGIITGVLGTGMTDVHTSRESIAVDDMVRATELLIEILRLHATDRR